MHHKQFIELMDVYLADELSEDIQCSFEEHMLECCSCRKTLILSQAIVDALSFYGRLFFFEEIAEDII